MLSVAGRRCPAAKDQGGAAAPPYLVIYRQLVDALGPLKEQLTHWRRELIYLTLVTHL